MRLFDTPRGLGSFDYYPAEDFIIERRQISYARGYIGMPEDEQYAIGMVNSWFAEFYRHCASHIVETIAYTLPTSFGETYCVAVVIKGTPAELGAIRQAVEEGLRPSMGGRW
jgi:hypothetical protein